ncbi:hypothetical protein HPB47_000832 [Ixodes persulcatus]|uniref:Uncharacterized protein n=1 Tax=Ixodes persulcatus TaxID=34615 RepID=A0AC60PRF8_IXOPE|nr:hypothetical protein HPB47_000832 [Ixodes persulcatus]
MADPAQLSDPAVRQLLLSLLGGREAAGYSNAVSYNGRSDVGPVDIPYEDELDGISMMDDSIEPEVIKDVHGATHKKAMPSSQARAAAAAVAAAEAIKTPADNAVAS